jgi:two-component system, NarL family, nitrate/nitrite response regulator NarL
MENPAPREVRLLLGQLIQKSKEREVSRKGQLATGAGSQQVVLDVHLEGVRYVLLCVRPSLNVHLSPREQDLVRMIAAGHPNKAIAQTLQISPWTICTHLRRIFGKLGVHSRAAMVAKSFELGLAAQQAVTGRNGKNDGKSLQSVRETELPIV